MRSRWAAEMTGPTTVVASQGSPTVRLGAAAASRSTSWSYTPRCTMARVGAVQIWPEWKPHTLTSAVVAAARSASSKTRHAPLPPSSSSRRFIVFAPDS
jgi:hypothetical protein